MGKYDPLSDRLSGHKGPEWRASFAEIEEVLGFPLPKAARAGRGWWSNGAWTAGGWNADLDAPGGKVVFRRADQSPLVAPAVAESATPPAPAASAAPDGEPAILKPLETPKWHMALVAGGLALVAGAGALVIRGLMRRGGKG